MGGMGNRLLWKAFERERESVRVWMLWLLKKDKIMADLSVGCFRGETEHLIPQIELED